MLKVLWLTNHIMPDHSHALGQTPSPRGGWMSALAEALVESGQLELGIATNVKGAEWRIDKINGIQYYAIPMPRRSIGGRLPKALIRDYQRVVEEFGPDVIHIHGMEYFQGLLTGRGHLKCPTVISIQGIIDVCERHYLGNIPLAKLITKRTLRDWLRFDGLIEQKLRWSKRARWEREIFVTNSAFIGRTTWDRAHTRRLNPKARHYHCDELIRWPFYNAQWEIDKIYRHSVFVSGASPPLKGFHVLVKAVSLLRREFPDINVRTPLAYIFPMLSGAKRFWKNCRSGGYSRYLTDLIRAEGLEMRIIPLPLLDANGMIKELLNAHAFVLPSLIENSPNSLAEAMLVGPLAIAAFVGGVPSMAQDDESVLLFPPGDEAVLAERIRRIFLDNDLACRLSAKAREVARVRHSKGKIVANILSIYKKVASNLADDKMLVNL